MIIRDSLLKSVSYETYRHLIDNYEAETLQAIGQNDCYS